MVKAQREVDRWNERMTPGAAVTYLQDDGRKIHTKTRGQAELLGGHTAVIWLDSIRGCVKLDRVKARPND